MRLLALFLLTLIICGKPAFAHDDSTTYNIKNAPAPKAHSDDRDDEDTSSGDWAPPKQELSTPQKEEAERRRINGEGSDVFHGDENSWPHSGRMH
jgi:hypothetical protein